MAVQFGRFAPSLDVAEGRMLRVSGALTVTVSSRQTGKHMTLRFRCSARDEFGRVSWPTVAFEDATHVFIDDFDGENVAVYEPARGLVRWSARATPAAQWTVSSLLRYLAGVNDRLLTQAEIAAVSHCRRCGRELTDPESIERGYGSSCFGEVTGSHAAAVLAGQSASRA